MVVGFNAFSKKGFTGVSKFKTATTANTTKRTADGDKENSGPPAGDEYESYFDMNEEEDLSLVDSNVPAVVTRQPTSTSSKVLVVPGESKKRLYNEISTASKGVNASEVAGQNSLL